MSSGEGIRHVLVIDVVNRQQDSDTANQTKRRTRPEPPKPRGKESGPKQGVTGTNEKGTSLSLPSTKYAIVEKTEVNGRGPAALGPVFAANQIPALLRGPPLRGPSLLRFFASSLLLRLGN
jgi:hypothetical protein